MATIKQNPIWCVPARSLVDNSGVMPHSFRIEHIRGRISAIERQRAENDPMWRQIIPYIVITTPDYENILRYRRGNQSGQKDLVDSYSIGFGGHVDVSKNMPIYFESDKAFWRALARDAVRELHEELGVSNVLHHPLRNKAIELFDSLTSNWFCGISSIFASKLENQIYRKLKTKQYQFIHRSDNITSRCHLGVCIVIELDMCEIKTAEVGHIECLAWQSSYALRRSHYEGKEKLEPWSEVALAYASDLEFARNGHF